MTINNYKINKNNYELKIITNHDVGSVRNLHEVDLIVKNLIWLTLNVPGSRCESIGGTVNYLACRRPMICWKQFVLIFKVFGFLFFYKLLRNYCAVLFYDLIINI